MASRSSVVLCAFVVASLLLAPAEVHASARKLAVDTKPDGRVTRPGTEKDATDDTPTGSWPAPSYSYGPIYPSPPY